MQYPSPAPDELIRFRAQTGLNQVDFGQMLYSSRRTVQNWESGTVDMPPALWELANLKLKPLIEMRQNKRAG